MVVLIPWVLALLGDNPMQSELSCHIGLRGKFFCRCCFVKGHEGDGEDDDAALPELDEDAPSEVGSEGTDNASDDSTGMTDATPTRGQGKKKQKKKKPRKKKKKQETMAELVDRAKRFLTVRR